MTTRKTLSRRRFLHLSALASASAGLLYRSVLAGDPDRDKYGLKIALNDNNLAIDYMAGTWPHAPNIKFWIFLSGNSAVFHDATTTGTGSVYTITGERDTDDISREIIPNYQGEQLTSTSVHISGLTDAAVLVYPSSPLRINTGPVQITSEGDSLPHAIVINGFSQAAPIEIRPAESDPQATVTLVFTVYGLRQLDIDTEGNITFDGNVFAPIGPDYAANVSRIIVVNESYDAVVDVWKVVDPSQSDTVKGITNPVSDVIYSTHVDSITGEATGFEGSITGTALAHEIAALVQQFVLLALQALPTPTATPVPEPVQMDAATFAAMFGFTATLADNALTVDYNGMNKWNGKALCKINFPDNSATFYSNPSFGDPNPVDPAVTAIIPGYSGEPLDRTLVNLRGFADASMLHDPLAGGIATGMITILPELQINPHAIIINSFSSKSPLQIVPPQYDTEATVTLVFTLNALRGLKYQKGFFTVDGQLVASFYAANVSRIMLVEDLSHLDMKNFNDLDQKLGFNPFSKPISNVLYSTGRPDLSGNSIGYAGSITGDKLASEISQLVTTYGSKSG